MWACHTLIILECSPYFLHNHNVNIKCECSSLQFAWKLSAISILAQWQIAQLPSQRIDSHIQHLFTEHCVICLVSEGRLKHSSGEPIQKLMIPTYPSDLIRTCCHLHHSISTIASLLHQTRKLVCLFTFRAKSPKFRNHNTKHEKLGKKPGTPHTISSRGTCPRLKLGPHCPRARAVGAPWEKKWG